MHNLTLTEPELQRLLKVFFYTAIGVWVIYVGGIFLFSDGKLELAQVLRAIPLAATLSGIAFAFLYRASWKYERIAQLLSRPVVHGAWCGTLVSDYRSDNGVELHIPIVFVVRQTYLSLSIQSYTPTQVGTSKLEGLVQDPRTGETRLRYVFELTRHYNNENKVTKGAGELRLQNKASALKGFYWTSTPTHGEIRLKLMSRDCEDVDCFEIALERWPTELAGTVKEIPLAVPDKGTPPSTPNSVS